MKKKNRVFIIHQYYNNNNNNRRFDLINVAFNMKIISKSFFK